MLAAPEQSWSAIRQRGRDDWALDRSWGSPDRDKRGLDPQSLLYVETSIRRPFTWADKHNSPHTLLPEHFRPLRGIERMKVPPRVLSETEVEALLDAARFDVDQLRRWGIEKPIEKQGRQKMRASKDSFGDMLKPHPG